MSNSTAESLAKELLGGTYKPGELEDCKSLLPTDRNPHVVRYTQFILFSNSDQNFTKEPEYLIFNFKHKSNPQTIIKNIVEPLAEKLTKDIPTAKLPKGDAPIENIRETIRNIGQKLPSPLSAAGLPKYGFELLGAVQSVTSSGPELVALGLPNLELSPNELRSDYADWLAEQRRQELLNLLEPLEKSGFISVHELPIKVTDFNKDMVDILKNIFLPPSSRPFTDPQPHFALYATFEQEWQPKGYTRGELINTLSLAPGEQLTLEFHSWDKTTFKSEEELLREAELRVSERLTERDSLTIAREMSIQQGSSAGGGFSVLIPDTPITVNANVANSDTIGESLRRTNERTHERTREASDTLKNTRKTRIEVSREIGREQKQTRSIANTNRCHALNCHYFEVMSNYLVRTQLVSIQPCLLFPNRKEEVTEKWVLCHEDVLRKVLLDKTFLLGFDAARFLEIDRQILIGGIRSIPPLSPYIYLRDDTGKVQEELERRQDQILADYRELQEALITVKKHAFDGLAVSTDPRAWAAYVAAKSGITRLRRVLYFALLHANDSAIYALQQLEDGKKERNPIEALNNFYASVSARAFQCDKLDNTTLAKGLEVVGVSKKLMDALMGWGFLDFTHIDDAGLYKDTGSTVQEMSKPTVGEEEDRGGIGGTPTPGQTTWPSGTPSGGEGKSEERAGKVAKAQVDFQQLKCHIEYHWPHYFQAVWLSQHPDERFSQLQTAFGSVANLIRNEVLGFNGNKAAYPITDIQALKEWLKANLPNMEDFEEKIKEIKEEVEQNEPQPQLITLPTPGTVLEAMVGQCDACEDFIQQSRLIDLRTQEAKARQEESEAKRYEKRVETEDFSDPNVPEAGKFIIKIEKEENEQPE